MPDRELGATTDPANRLQKANAERTAQFEESGARVHDRDPIDQIASRPDGNVPSAKAHASALNHTTGFQPSRAKRSLLQLQRQYGNHYVEHVVSLAREDSQRDGSQVLNRTGIRRGQPSLSPRPGTTLVAHKKEDPSPTAQRDKMPEEEEKERTAQIGRMTLERVGEANNGVSPHAEAAVSVASTSVGKPLPSYLQGKFEHAFGVDLRPVRIHTGPQSVAATRAVSAPAYTTGNDIHFNHGEHNPDTAEGQHLLAHEVAHTVQQGGAQQIQKEPHESTIDGLNRLIDPMAAPGPIQRNPQTRTMTFEPEVVEGRVATLDPRARGDAGREISALMTDLTNTLRNTQIGMTAGITMFLTDQAFAGAKESEADFNGVFLKYAGKKMLEFMVEKVGEEIPYLKPIWSLTFGLIEEIDKEAERASKARGEVEVRKFIGDYLGMVANSFNKRIDDIPNTERALQTDYARIESASPALSTPTPSAGAAPGTNVAGDAAEFLSKLRKVVKGIKSPKAEDCLRLIIEQWITQAEGDLMSRGGGDMYMNGRINLSAKMYRDGDKWKIVEKPDKGVLAAPRADHVISSIEHAVFTRGGTINDLNVLKTLTIDVEDEVWGFNDHYYVHVTWRSAADMVLGETVPSPVNGETVQKAPGIGLRAFNEIKIKDLSVTKLEPIAGGGEKV
jgi:Domain of unknown function (DUF4157)